MIENVILVDENDNEIGVEEKIKAHQNAKLHRAFSVFIFNSKGEMLLQQRARTKYHSGGQWSNACCSHPRSDENVEQAAHRRLKEEMGFDCELKKQFHFIYRADLDHDLTEHELDHVLTGKYEGDIHPDPEEVMDIQWTAIDDLKKDIKDDPDKYTVWFKIILEKVLKRLGN